mmetsp:Transcript_25328/g.37392  ORF Transcript_25328/g.37392 Transcript_25328/m.37392 type:complete len:330 (-) Transcript_25328:112-1101(-)
MISPGIVSTQGHDHQKQKMSTLTFSRDWLRHIASETVEISIRGTYTNTKGEVILVRDALDYAMENSVHYHSCHDFKLENPKTKFDTQYRVCYGSSIELATNLYREFNLDNTHIGVLNSASGKSPGGKFFRGTISQEDCICRASLLYPCLLQYQDKVHHFYKVNSRPKYHSSNSSCAIFCPLVPIIRKDTMRGELLDHFLKVSFISIPAPNAFALGPRESVKSVPKPQSPGANDRNEPYEYMSLEEAMFDRCFRALCILAEHKCTELVLCAFGCGVHGNNPEEIAKCFRGILETNEFKGRFRTVVFAIQSSRHANYTAFENVFCKDSMSR